MRTGIPHWGDLSSEKLAHFWAGVASEHLANWRHRVLPLEAMWKQIGIDPKVTQDLRVLDLGCGSGIKSFALIRKNKRGYATIVDWAPVLVIAYKLAETMEISDRVTTKPGNIAHMELGRSKFNVVLLGNVPNYFSSEEVLAVLHRVYRCLIRGGLIVVNATMVDEDRRSSKEQLILRAIWLQESPGGEVRSTAEYEAMLVSSGFVDTVRHDHSWGLVTGVRG